MFPTVFEMEQIFNEIVSTTYPRTWEENHISLTLMEKMQDFFNRKRIVFPQWSKIVDWQSYKNRGKQETNFGDIAILVNIQFLDGGTLKGVACLEAKRSFFRDFDSLDQTQVERIYGNLPHSQLLLYTHYDPSIPMKFPEPFIWHSHMWVTSLNTTKELLPQVSDNNSRILRTSFPLSKFLMSRIFWGQDLDYRDTVYDDIVTGMKRVTEAFDPAFLGVVNVFYDEQSPVETILSSEVWEKIESK